MGNWDEVTGPDETDGMEQAEPAAEAKAGEQPEKAEKEMMPEEVTAEDSAREPDPAPSLSEEAVSEAPDSDTPVSEEAVSGAPDSDTPISEEAVSGESLLAGPVSQQTERADISDLAMIAEVFSEQEKQMQEKAAGEDSLPSEQAEGGSSDEAGPAMPEEESGLQEEDLSWTDPVQEQKARELAEKKKKARQAREASRKKAVRMLLTGCVLWGLSILLVIVLALTEHFSEKKKQSADMMSVTEASTEVAEEVYTWDTIADVDFQPAAVESTAPSNMIQSTSVMQEGRVLSSVSDYSSSWGEISMGLPQDYTQAQGVITFRGNNFRNDPTYGYADITENTLTQVWSKEIGALTFGSHTWSGCGWTGQPLIVKWPEETKQIMNLYDWAKEDENMVEVIYATMDGNIYFLDLNTGKATRDPMYLGYTFKGAGALDPRGYPILYVGSGYHTNNSKSRAFIISLIDCSILYSFGYEDSFAYRSNVSFFDSSALVDAETDTLIYPGENGVLYLIHLNTAYDESAGTLTIDPKRTEWNYWGYRSSTEDYWVGMEDSACVYKGYLFVADNGGHMMCLNLNTLQLVWVQDILDDSNSTPVLSVENDHLYLYVSTSFHLGWRSSNSATVPIWKLDAETGEIIWQTDYTCWSDDGVSGGVQSTIAVGKGELSDNIYVTVSKTDSTAHGCLASLDKETGAVNWENTTYYTWSSPVCVYNEDGSGKVVYCTCDGKLRLVDGLTGEEYAQTALSDGSIEASPAVYEDMLVVGTRAGKIWGVQLN